MKYIVFYGECYYARGGANDYLKGFNDLDEAKKFSDSVIPESGGLDAAEWWHILDTETLEIVLESEEQAHGA